MDKKIKKEYWSVQRIVSYSVGSLITLVTLYFLFFGGNGSSVKIDRDKVTVSEVRTGIFQEYIPQTGTVEPKYTFYLDAIEGGVIKKVHKESGSILMPGDVILELSNLNRELSVLGQEASLNESINRVRQTRLSLEQNDLQQLQTLAEIDNQIQKLGPQYTRNKQLFKKKLISKQEFEQIEADYFYNLKRHDITYRSYKKDSLSRKRQLVQLNQSEQRMSQSLEGVGKILDNLVVKSPIEGQLSAPNLFEGQSISPGERLGQVDVVGTYKIKSRIDELYLPKIDTGLKATTTINGEDYELKIIYIYPTITEGRFEVDLEFTNKIPEGIKRGQTLRLRIELGDSTEETLINSGAFFNKTGGNWIYVLNEDGTKATKRTISLGRENSEAYVVLSGLAPGEKAITSSYDNFGDNDIIKFK